MEKTRDILNAAAELFDLPPDVVAGLPRLELIGNRQLFLERHRGLLSYSPDCIETATPAGILRLNGAKLELLSMNPDALRVGGLIRSVEWTDGEHHD